jgi:hypothetical protein
MVEVGIPVMGIWAAAAVGAPAGRLRRQAVQREDIEALVEDAHALERAASFAIVLEASATTRRGRSPPRVGARRSASAPGPTATARCS